MTRRLTVRELAAEGGRDPEEALVILWDQGLDYVRDVDEHIRTNDMSRSRRALGVPSPKDRVRIEFWAYHLQMTRQEFINYLEELGIQTTPNARNLPKGGLKKLERAIKADEGKSAIFAKNLGQEAQRSQDQGGDEAALPTPSLDWSPVGRVTDIEYLDVFELEEIHERLVNDAYRSQDPIYPPGVSDRNLLEMAATRPGTSLGETLKYPTVEMAAGALLHSLVHNHPFHNGNKRTALVTMLCLLDRNGLVLTCSEDELFRFVLKVAQHRLVPSASENKTDWEVRTIAEWIRTNSRSIDKSDRPLKWRELKAILRKYDCDYEVRSGNRLNICRPVTVKKGLLRRARTVELKVQASYPDDGREVPRGQLHQLRRALMLDEEHGVDSSAFYGEEPAIDDFIAEYRKVLRRLAKL